ncbi:MAG: hypothetical protein D6785_00500 [Planctomycetota bacterium]|nr:MAG: hypothetical protein D6785_00500 [Planctomycetota bacterium]
MTWETIIPSEAKGRFLVIPIEAQRSRGILKKYNNKSKRGNRNIRFLHFAPFGRCGRNDLGVCVIIDFSTSLPSVAAVEMALGGCLSNHTRCLFPSKFKVNTKKKIANQAQFIVNAMVIKISLGSYQGISIINDSISDFEL